MPVTMVVVTVLVTMVPVVAVAMVLVVVVVVVVVVLARLLVVVAMVVAIFGCIVAPPHDVARIPSHEPLSQVPGRNNLAWGLNSRVGLLISTILYYIRNLYSKYSAMFCPTA